MGQESAGPPHGRAVLEVIVSCLEDALEAERGGAGRLEIVSHLERGGLTPNFKTVQEICDRVAIPVRVMLRCGESHIPRPGEVENLKRQAEELSALRIDGLVLGFLKADQVDLTTTQDVMSRAPNLKATFHRAFDETLVPLSAISQLKEIRQVDRILTSGGHGAWNIRAERLERYRQAGGPELMVLAGGGLDRFDIQRLFYETGIREFHSGRAVRIPQEPSGRVRTEKVREIVESLHRIGTHRRKDGSP